jgi:N-acetylmuramoyl-L-alanine amidase
MKIKALKRLIYGLSVFVICLLLFSFKLQASTITDTVVNKGFKVKTIIVDAGHGGKRPGAYGSYSVEKNVTLQIALKLQKAIEKDIPDVNVIMTRTDDTDVGFQTRADIANSNKGNLFISIHCNSLPDRRASTVVGYKKGKRGKKTPIYKTVNVPDRSGKGVLLLVYSLDRVGAQNEALRENADLYEDPDYKKNPSGHDPSDPASVILLNAFKNKYRKQSIHIADLINSEFVETDGRRSDGVKGQVVIVLDHTAMPSVLVETGFINNADDEAYLNSDSGQTQIVNSIVRAIKNYKKDAEQVSQ